VNLEKANEDESRYKLSLSVGIARYDPQFPFSLGGGPARMGTRGKDTVMSDEVIAKSTYLLIRDVRERRLALVIRCGRKFLHGGNFSGNFGPLIGS